MFFYYLIYMAKYESKALYRFCFRGQFSQTCVFGWPDCLFEWRFYQIQTFPPIQEVVFPFPPNEHILYYRCNWFHVAAALSSVLLPPQCSKQLTKFRTTPLQLITSINNSNKTFLRAVLNVN